MAELAADEENHQGATCRVHVTTATADASLARVVGVLRRTRWSVRELHYRGGAEHDEVEIEATKRRGRPDLLVAQLRREVLVIDVQPRSVAVVGDQAPRVCEPSNPHAQE